MRIVEQLTLICALFTVGLAAADPTCASTDSDAQAALVLSVKVMNKEMRLPSFSAFLQEHGRTYQEGSDEYELRSKIYAKSLEHVSRQNRIPNRRWDAGINHLSDRTEAEFKQLRGLRAMATGKREAVETKGLLEVSNATIPDEKDWSHLEAVKRASDQGGCGSCWAVATATTLTANAEAKGHAHIFSAQELVSCVPNTHHCGGSGGCFGSTVELALNWVMEHGLADISETPYQGTDTTCKKGPNAVSWLAPNGHHDRRVHLTPNGHHDHQMLEQMIAVGLHEAASTTSPGLALGLLRWERLPENEYEPLMRAVAEHGPVAISVGAGGFASYSRGVYDGCGVDAEIDHAVTLVGYGKDATSGDKFWKVKNSWGAGWGEGGFIRLLREEDEKAHCGTDHQPKVGTACDGGPATVPVCGMCGILYDNVVPHFEQKI